MNKEAGSLSNRNFVRRVVPLLLFLVLASVFLPLPFIVLAAFLAIAIVLKSRAAPLRDPVPLVRFLRPPALRGPPY
jgi:hypothetical protein